MSEITMDNLSKSLLKTVVIAFFCNSLICCGIPIETSHGTFTIGNADEEELRLNHQNPNRMINELESDRWMDTSESIIRQNRKEGAARDKKLNEIIEKQLRGDQTISNELPAIDSGGARPTGGGLR